MGSMPPDDEPRRKRRTAWAIAAVLFGGSVVNYLDRAVLGVVMPQIRRDLVLTNQQYGWVINAFLVAYMISYVLGGRLADRFGYRRVVACAIGIWSLAGMSHALVRGW
jgi:ACS family hexuronate transporter-like MFS transporter